MKRLAKKIIRVFISGSKVAAPCRVRHTYSQCGEDAIVSFIFKCMKQSKPTYLDIGASDPVYLSNTYLSYLQGGRGVCVDANPAKAELFQKIRPGDRFLTCGVAPDVSEEKLDFFVMTDDVLSTLDGVEAERMCREEGAKLEKTIKVPVKTLNQIAAAEFDSQLDFVSLDVEGLDLAILRSFDFSQCRPAVWCVETISYSCSGQGAKSEEHKRVFEMNDYFLYADTYINSIFVDRKWWSAGRLQDSQPTL